jgi:uncharacterized oxidoreductase
MGDALDASRSNDGVNLQGRRNVIHQAAGMDMSGRKVLITGGNSGVGAALVDLLSGLGAHVVTCGRRPALSGSAHPNVQYVTIDLADRGAGRRLVEEAVRLLGGLDTVINNAAIQELTQYVPTPAEIDPTTDAEISINLRAPVDITAHALPHLLASDSPVVVFVTSGLAVFPKQSAPLYCATKSALRTFAMALRDQLDRQTTRVHVVDAVLPLVATPMTAGRADDQRKMSAGDVALRIVQGIERGHPTVYIGKARLLPWLVRIAPSIGRRALRNG